MKLSVCVKSLHGIAFAALVSACAADMPSTSNAGAFIHPDVGVGPYLVADEPLSFQQQLHSLWAMSVDLGKQGESSKREVASCEEALLADEQGYTPLSPSMSTTFNNALVQCRAVSWAAELRAGDAAPPEFKLDQATIEGLPAELAFIPSEVERSRSLARFLTWGDANPTGHCQLVEEFKALCSINGAQQQFKLLMIGDINGDDVPDIALEVVNSVSEGSYRAMKLYLLSPGSESAEWVVIDQY